MLFINETNQTMLNIVLVSNNFA